MSDPSLVPHPCEAWFQSPSPPPGWVGQVRSGRAVCPRQRWQDDLGHVLQKRLPCVLLLVSLQEQLHARHVSRKNPQNHCSNRELRLTGLVLVVQLGPMRMGWGLFDAWRHAGHPL